MAVAILHGNSVTASTVWIKQSSVLATELRPTGEGRRLRASMDALTKTMSLLRLVIVSVVMRFPVSQEHLHGWIDAMLRVGGDEDIAPNVYAGTGTFLERDDRQPIQEVV